MTIFLSTPSARRATPDTATKVVLYEISIHALREEGDRASSSRRCHSMYFYPRPPRGGRLNTVARIYELTYFYPRPPRGGRPPAITSKCTLTRYFYPRPPRGGRLSIS